jgi:hypothetical protein
MIESARRVVDEWSLPAYRELAAAVWTEGAELANLEHLRWKYLQNPAGNTLTLELIDGKTVVGMIAYQARSYRWRGRVWKSAYLTDLMIDPRHRSLKHFVALCGRFREIGDFDFIFATPNDGSAPLHEQVLGFQRRFELDVFVIPLRPMSLLKAPGFLRFLDRLAAPLHRLSGALAGSPGRLRVDDAAPNAEELSRLESAADDPASLLPSVDAARLSWRFEKCPTRDYRVRSIRGEDGGLRGYFVVRRGKHMGLQALFLADCLLLPEDRRAGSALVRKFLLQEGLESGADLVLGIFNSRHPRAAELCRFPLLRVPARFLPQRVPVFAAACPSMGLGASAGPFEAASFPVSIADLDVI